MPCAVTVCEAVMLNMQKQTNLKADKVVNSYRISDIKSKGVEKVLVLKTMPWHIEIHFHLHNDLKIPGFIFFIYLFFLKLSSKEN